MFKTLIGAAALVALTAGAANAAVVYSQTSNNFGGFYSQNDVGGLGNFITTYDNFTLAASANLTSINFVGSYTNPPGPGTITAFTIAFYANSAGAPGAQLYSVTIAGNGGETALGTDTLLDSVFSYSENISFAATGGTQYWLSIVPNLTLPSRWEWENSNQGDGGGYQNIFGTVNRITSDSAFTLNSGVTQVPEPATLSLFGAGLLGVGGVIALRRRRTKRA